MFLLKALEHGIGFYMVITVRSQMSMKNVLLTKWLILLVQILFVFFKGKGMCYLVVYLLGMNKTLDLIDQQHDEELERQVQAWAQGSGDGRGGW